MVKRLLALLLLPLCGLLVGCSLSATGNVDDLLRAPQLTGKQNQVQKAIIAYLGESPQFKYPERVGQSQSRTPFVFGDWNGDGVEDAAAFYVSPAKGQNVHIAVLEQTENGWVVTQEKEGIATSVETIAMAEMQTGSGVQLLVGYAGAVDEKYLAVYSYANQTLTELLRQPYSQYELRDLTDSGVSDLVIIGPESGEGLQLQLLTSVDGRFVLAQQLALSGHFTSCEGLYNSRGEDGSSFLVLDGYNENGGGLASAILHYNARLQQLEEFTPITESDFYLATQRYSTLLTSRDIDQDGAVEIPRQIDTPVAGNLTVNRLSFVAWMDYTSDYDQQKSFGVTDLVYGFYLELPASLKGEVMLTDGSDADSWDVRSLDGQHVYLTVRVVAPNVAEGKFVTLGNIGAQKVQAYVASDNPLFDEATLAQKFFVL